MLKTFDLTNDHPPRPIIFPTLVRAEAALSSQNFTKEVFTRDDKKEEFDLMEPSKIYYVQTRETEVSDDSPRYILNLPQLPKMDGPFQPSSAV